MKEVRERHDDLHDLTYKGNLKIKFKIQKKKKLSLLGRMTGPVWLVTKYTQKHPVYLIIPSASHRTRQTVFNKSLLTE